MSWTRTPYLRFMATLVGGALLIFTAMHVARAAGYRLTGPGVAAVGVIWAAVAWNFVIRYWRDIDEAAREAQKWAWYWGGSLGMGLGLIVTTSHAIDVSQWFPADASRQALVTYGAWVLLAGQIIGFHAAWVYWWWSRR